ncbi:HAD family hydrolase [Salinimicrobium xinjiangense]|uniref:HAD family hydrolase n=1 Tax=Salinimicrobium xinjiangense TaxID=438596 RepID=UPI001B7FEDC4|nr:HAD family hydrolase [Salinimicrobium xinjiangense]
MQLIKISMDYSKIRLIVSDMDGTLLNSEHKVSDRFFEAFQKLKKQEIKFAVASGRQYYSLMERMEPVKDEMIYIAENGAIVMEKGEERHLVPMKMDLVHQIVKEVREIGGKYLILCGREQAYIENDDPEFMEPFLNHYEKYKVVNDLLEVSDDVILKVTICDLEGAEKNSLPHVEHFKDDLQVKLSGEIWIDFNDKEAQKGNALKALQEILDISKEETMAFGDYLNDLELFEHAEIGYAVENAHPEVKEVAAYTTKSNDNFGVEIILEELLERATVASEK